MKQQLKEKAIVLLIAFVLVIFGTIFDLGISVQFVDKTSIIGRLFENHMLILALGPLLYAVLAQYRNTKNLVYLIAGIGIAIYLGFNNTQYYLIGIARYFSLFVVATVLFFAVYLLVYSKNETTLKLSQSRYEMMIKVSIAVIVTIHSIKLLDGRIRYRDFSDFITYREFSPWYQFNFLGRGNSFPSGHSSTFYLIVPYLTLLNIDQKQYRITAYILVFIMAFSRVRIGAHFLSDTMIGLIIAIIWDVILMRKLINER